MIKQENKKSNIGCSDNDFHLTIMTTMQWALLLSLLKESKSNNNQFILDHTLTQPVSGNADIYIQLVCF